MSRADIKPILKAIPAARQQDARHYGVHPYFTRRPANVVRAYIEHYSREGETVLDPFGGSGVTAIEALLLGRRAIHNDLNPFANFLAQTVGDTTLSSIAPLHHAFERVERECKESVLSIEASENVAEAWLKKLALPENIRLPRNSDAERFLDLFTTRQLAGLALIKRSIDAEPPGIVRDCLLLGWSASIAKLNKTFLSAKGRLASRGGSSIFSIYRYKLAAEPVELPIWDTFRGRFRNVIAAKEEVLQCRRYREERDGGSRLDSRQHFRVLATDACRLREFLKPESVDYILTDPPYGAFISYLDLSILWNHWLGFPVSQEDLSSETIVGGELGHSEEHYKQSLANSIRVCVELLKPDRWFSIVFQHWDLTYFATILETAAQAGAELKAAITHTGDVIWSMHKKKNSARVIAGEMILTFYKPAVPSKRKEKTLPQAEQIDPTRLLSEVFDFCLADEAESFSSEALLNQLVVELWHRRALTCLSFDRREFTQRLAERGWQYDPQVHLWKKTGRQPSQMRPEPMLYEIN
jgi:adenine-specific DNA methylase